MNKDMNEPNNDDDDSDNHSESNNSSMTKNNDMVAVPTRKKRWTKKLVVVTISMFTLAWLIRAFYDRWELRRIEAYFKKQQTNYNELFENDPWREWRGMDGKSVMSGFFKCVSGMDNPQRCGKIWLQAGAEGIELFTNDDCKKRYVPTYSKYRFLHQTVNDIYDTTMSQVPERYNKDSPGNSEKWIDSNDVCDAAFPIEQ